MTAQMQLLMSWLNCWGLTASYNASTGRHCQRGAVPNRCPTAGGRTWSPSCRWRTWYCSMAGWGALTTTLTAKHGRRGSSSPDLCVVPADTYRAWQGMVQRALWLL
jgi:hypothetical protein